MKLVRLIGDTLPLAIVCLLILLAPTASLRAEPAVGKIAPEFTGQASDGKIYSLNDFRGKTVILEWTNHQCPFVGKHYGTGNMQALQKQAKKDGVVWLSIISSAPGKQGHVSKDKANELTKSRNAIPKAVILDSNGEIGNAYGATATPHMFVIDPTGVLVYKGAIDDKPTSNHGDIKGAKNYVRLALQAISDGGEVSNAATRAYGCSIKY